MIEYLNSISIITLSTAIHWINKSDIHKPHRGYFISFLQCKPLPYLLYLPDSFQIFWRIPFSYSILQFPPIVWQDSSIYIIKFKPYYWHFIFPCLFTLWRYAFTLTHFWVLSCNKAPITSSIPLSSEFICLFINVVNINWFNNSLYILYKIWNFLQFIFIIFKHVYKFKFNLTFEQVYYVFKRTKKYENFTMSLYLCKIDFHDEEQ